jgi:UDP-N-acetylmuramate--alanine ligase
MHRPEQPIFPGPDRPVHVVGLGGVGMSAVAQALRCRGYAVSGSDRNPDLPVLTALQAQGIALHPQDGVGVTASTGAVVVSTAIEADNPDVQRAAALGVPVWHRAAALAALIGEERCVAIAGTSGKTTVTGMVGWILSECGYDPMVVNGGAVINWRETAPPGNVRAGRQPLWVIEADESDRSLLQFRPEWAAITTISEDHFDLAESVALFQQFSRQVARGVCCGEGVAALLEGAAVTVPAQADAALASVLALPGVHNQRNAELAVTLCEQVGVERAQAVAALARFRGMERRLELVDTVDGVRFYDEYAHNPEKIAAAWAAVAQEARGRVWSIWRPHGFGPLAALADALEPVFRSLTVAPHRLLLLPVYYAGGTAERRMDSVDLVARLSDLEERVVLMPSWDVCMAHLLEQLQPEDTVLCMGARDPMLPVFVRQLAARWRAVRETGR